MLWLGEEEAYLFVRTLSVQLFHSQPFRSYPSFVPNLPPPHSAPKGISQPPRTTSPLSGSSFARRGGRVRRRRRPWQHRHCYHLVVPVSRLLGLQHGHRCVLASAVDDCNLKCGRFQHTVALVVAKKSRVTGSGSLSSTSTAMIQKKKSVAKTQKLAG